ncbi:hypothetical protein [Agarivorans sp. DSG3-1]|uniref:hypothetical protein n=1 Tax=Agarivorans sp. DSG3-1 TaxID=3342249 RepID=UPI00398E8F32
MHTQIQQRITHSFSQRYSTDLLDEVIDALALSSVTLERLAAELMLNAHSAQFFESSECCAVVLRALIEEYSSRLLARDYGYFTNAYAAKYSFLTLNEACSRHYDPYAVFDEYVFEFMSELHRADSLFLTNHNVSETTHLNYLSKLKCLMLHLVAKHDELVSVLTVDLLNNQLCHFERNLGTVVELSPHEMLGASYE